MYLDIVFKPLAQCKHMNEVKFLTKLSTGLCLAHHNYTYIS